MKSNVMGHTWATEDGIIQVFTFPFTFACSPSYGVSFLLVTLLKLVTYSNSSKVSDFNNKNKTFMAK